MGGLPAPSDVAAFAKKGSLMVFLKWTEVDDPRIAGYRVYRAAGNDELACQVSMKEQDQSHGMGLALA